jgi:hypothetical protein
MKGTDFKTLPVEEQKKYVLRDAELVMQLSKHNNGEVLDAMKAISELIDLDFEKVCRTDYPRCGLLFSTIWCQEESVKSRPYHILAD